MAIYYRQKGQTEQPKSCWSVPFLFFTPLINWRTPMALQFKQALPKVVPLIWLSALALLLYGYSEMGFALAEGDKVKELAGLTDETQKIVKTGCYIAGSASALVGAIWAVASQSLKVAASSAAVTIIALKAAGFFSGTLFI